jgi:hypothetical protein
LLVTSDPGDPKDPLSWPVWARLMPHIIALDAGISDDPSVRDLAGKAAWYLLMRGDTRGAHDLARELHEQWKLRLGTDHYATLYAANCLGVSLRRMGRYAESRQVNEDVLARWRQSFGEDHRATLAAANALALDLADAGEHQAARDLEEDTLSRKRRVLGEDHPDTLTSARNLAADLRALGESPGGADS